MNLTKKLLKKAFTLVELVVVIAVIAILSAVSVAAYVGITDRTKTEADKANVGEWNTLLKVETVEGTLNNVIEVQDYFNNQGFGDEDYIPRTNGYGYYYCLGNNTVYLVDDFNSTFDVAYPEDTVNEVNQENSYRLNNTYCSLISSIEGLTFSRNALVVGQDNEVGVSADPMPARVIINSTEYILSNGKITIHPDSSAQLTASESDTLLNATVTKPSVKSNLTYNGSAQELVSAGTTNGGTWYYKVDGGSYSTSIPTAIDAGTYTVYFKLDGGTNYHDIAEESVSVNINAASATTTAPTVKSNLTYNGSAQELINKGTTNGGKWKYKLNDGGYSTSIPTATNAGTYTVYYKLDGESNYKDVAEQSVSVTIAKAKATTNAPKANNLTYNGSAQALVSAGTTNGGTWQYKLSGGSYSTSIPTATNAGTYTVSYKLVGDSNYSDIAENSVNVTIAKATAVSVAPTAKTGLEYTGSALELVNAGTTNGGTWQYRLESTEYSTNIPTATATGSYNVYYKLVGGTNYNDIDEANFTVTIESAKVSFSGLCFTANTAGSTVELTAVGDLSSLISDTSYSTDGSTWTTFTPSTTAGTNTITLTNAGDKVYFKNNIIGNLTSSTYLNFVMSGSVSASGNVNSMYDVDDFEDLTTLTYTYCYYKMFYGCTSLTSTPTLPATTLSSSCYYYMFSGCTSLTSAPALQAEALGTYCYEYMFNGCTSLSSAPALPATTLTQNCYYKMFSGCTSLTSAPALPATELAISCYESMFSGCTSLISTPVLGSTSLAQGCYYGMFDGCTSITTAPALPATKTVYRCYGPMLRNTSITTAPALPATNAAHSCYISMFSGCTSLKSAPALPATSLNYCSYEGMFSGCTSLTSAPTLSVTSMKSQCYSSMFKDCTSLTSAPALPATTLNQYCYYYMFSGCTSLKSAPALPAKTLKTYCYYYMFSGCTSLTSAPALPATTLASYCYDHMFYNCSSLTSAGSIETVSKTYDCCYAYMFYNCTALKVSTSQGTTGTLFWTTPTSSVLPSTGNAGQWTFYNCGCSSCAAYLSANKTYYYGCTA